MQSIYPIFNLSILKIGIRYSYMDDVGLYALYK